MNKEIQKIEGYRKYPSIHGIIVDLRAVVDSLDDKFKKFQDIILELAKRLDEDKICERSQISQAIKKILQDKIKEGKISSKWIEICLPKEYKRKYNDKNIDESQLSSLSVNDQETNKEEILLVQNPKSNSLENIEGQVGWIESKLKDKTLDNSKLAKLEVNGCDLCRDVFAENIELKEALKKNSEFLSAQRLKNEINIPKEKFNDVISEINKNNQFLNIKFDIYGNILSIKSDIPMGVTI